MALILLIGRPLMMTIDSLVRNNAVIPNVTTLIRWQSHWHVLRQSWSFFQDDFAGRIANRVMNTANSLRETVVSSIRAVWYILVYGISALILMLSTDVWLALPTLAWMCCYLVFLWYFVPRMRDLSKLSSEARSARPAFNSKRSISPTVWPTKAKPQYSNTLTSISRPVSESGLWVVPVPESQPSSIYCCAFTMSKVGAS
jgi:ABC-type multidrug transport system fused ATPase/permease subunit